MSLDDLRSTAANSFEDEINLPTVKVPAPHLRPRPRQAGSKSFLGLKPAQRFILALMIFLLTCIVGTFCLLITESVYLF